MAKITELAAMVEKETEALEKAKGIAKSKKQAFDNAEKDLNTALDAVESATQSLQKAKDNLKEAL